MHVSPIPPLAAVWGRGFERGQEKNMKKLMVCCIVLLLVSGAYAQEKRFNVPVEESPVIGPENAAVTMIEFVDYQ